MTGVIAVFPGQGSQQVGMGKELCANFKVARLAFEEASDAASLNLKSLCFDGPESDLTLTENTQPCLLTTSVAAFRVAQTELGFKPQIALGHSLGEYSALVASGALSLATAARWVRERGRAMQSTVPVGQGTMAAVMGLDDAVVESLCRQATLTAKAKRAGGLRPEIDDTVETWVEPANYNAPGQIAIAGSIDAVEEALSLLKSGASAEFAGGKGVPLSVSAPFHSKLMRGARDQMANVFSGAAAHTVGELAQPYVPNRTARPSRESALILELLLDQIDHPVLWKQSFAAGLDFAAQSTASLASIEFGPGKVLAGLGKRIFQNWQKTQSVRAEDSPPVLDQISVGDASTLTTLETWMKKAGHRP